jgi:hypothetical protein
MHRAAMNIVLRCPSIKLTLADLSIDFSDNGGLEGSLEERRTVFLSAKYRAGCHYILIISDRGTSLFVNFFVSVIAYLYVVVCF